MNKLFLLLVLAIAAVFAGKNRGNRKQKTDLVPAEELTQEENNAKAACRRDGEAPGFCDGDDAPAGKRCKKFNKCKGKGFFTRCMQKCRDADKPEGACKKFCKKKKKGGKKGKKNKTDGPQ